MELQVGVNRTQAARKASRSPKIRPAEFEDYAQIVALQIAYQRPGKSYEEWENLWAHNPAYLSSSSAWPKGWVVERADGRIVGYLGNIPLHYEFGGQRLLTAVAHAWVVDAEYRPYSLALLDLYFSQKNVDLFLNATVGPNGHDSFTIFDSPRVPAGDWQHSAFLITNRRGFSAAWLAQKAVPMAKPLSFGLAGALAMKQVFSFSGLPRNGAGHSLQLCESIDSRFDVFWKHLRKNSPNRLLAVRTREALEWHFRFPLRNNEIWILTEGTNPITAYAIFLRYDNAAAGLSRMRLIDFQSLDGDAGLLAPMVAWALERCRREGIHMFEMIGFRPEKMKVINELSPYKRKLPCWMYFYKAPRRGLAEKLTDASAWDPSQFDSDASL